MKTMFEITYQMEDGNKFVELFPCKDANRGEKAIMKRMKKEFFDVGPVSIETAGVMQILVTEHSVH